MNGSGIGENMRKLANEVPNPPSYYNGTLQGLCTRGDSVPSHLGLRTNDRGGSCERRWILWMRFRKLTARRGGEDAVPEAPLATATTAHTLLY